MKATPVEDAYDGTLVLSQDGSNWLIFNYTDEDKDPWKWPRIMQCCNKYFKRMSWDSDKKEIYYKECQSSEIAFAR